MRNRLMKSSALGVVVMLWGCGVDLPEASEPSVGWRSLRWSSDGGNAFQEEDGVVLETVLADLLKNKEFRPVGAGKDELVLDEYTRGDSPYLSHSEISRDKLRISYEVEAALRARNRAAVCLDQFQSGNANFPVRDLSKLEGGGRFWEAFRDAYPNAIGYVRPWLPVYSTDGKMVLLRFWFGPTAHGAVGTYLLMKKDGRWIVVWRSLSYFG